MDGVIPLTMSRLGRLRALSGRLGRGSAVVALLSVSACTVEVGPPPESDPPLVPRKVKVEAPAQPSEPQPWSRDLDLDSGPTRVDPDELAAGLVASEGEVVYSGERLTYESALNDEGPLSEAELTLKRARERARAAGMPEPPAVPPPPLAEVSEESLPPVGETAPAPEAAVAPSAPRRQSRLPPPPKFPPLPPKDGATEAAPPAAAPQVAALPAQDPPAIPPVAPPPAPSAPTASPSSEAGAAATGGVMEKAGVAPFEENSGAQAEVFAAEAWNAPPGTILVQVSAVQEEDSVLSEWERLRARYPQVLKPLRLVVEQARLGDRGVFYRVQAGAFGSEDGASAACQDLINAGQPCFVVVR